MPLRKSSFFFTVGLGTDVKDPSLRAKLNKIDSKSITLTWVI
jgi:hypothetical protein